MAKTPRKKCSICGTEFSYFVSTQKYCSPTCAAVARKEKQRVNSKRAEKKNISSFNGTKGKVTLKCKQCGKEYERYASQVKFRGSAYCSPECKKQPKVKSVSKLKAEADKVFSSYIRQKYADSSGYVTCVTCGVAKPIKEMQAGHYEKRSVNSLRFDERNVHPQCPGCNVFKQGNYPRYATFMINRYGQEILDELEKEAKTLMQFKAHQLEAIISLYKAKLESLHD